MTYENDSPDLEEVGCRLDKIIFDKTVLPHQRYEIIESQAIAVLDSEHTLHDENALEVFLLNYLAEKRRVLGISFP